MSGCRHHKDVLCPSCSPSITMPYPGTNEEAAMSGDSHESPVDHDERCCMTVAGATEPHDICPGIPKSVAVSSCTCWRRSDDAHNHPPGWPCSDWCPEHPDHADSGVCGKVTHP